MPPRNGAAGASFPTPEQQLISSKSAPVLRTVIDVQDLYGFSFHRINHDIRERGQRQFSCAAAMPGSAPVR